MVDTGLARYFIADNHVADIDHSVELSPLETFTLKQTVSGRQLMLGPMGSYAPLTPVALYGRPVVTQPAARARADVL